jgi:hypothetical protein
MVTSEHNFVVRMTSRDGRCGVYTGRAGLAFFSQDDGAAFGYAGYAAAADRAKILNRTGPLHGFDCWAEPVYDTAPAPQDWADFVQWYESLGIMDEAAEPTQDRLTEILAECGGFPF